MEQSLQHLRLKVEELKKRNDGIKEARQSSLSHAQHTRPTSHPGNRHESLTATMPPPSSHRRTLSQGRSRRATTTTAADSSLALPNVDMDLERVAMAAAALDEQPLMRSGDPDPADSLDSDVGSRSGARQQQAVEESPTVRQSSRVRGSSAGSEGGGDVVAPNRQVAAAGVATSRRANATMGAMPRRPLPKGTVVTG
jgi:hypothetical protein